MSAYPLENFGKHVKLGGEYFDICGMVDFQMRCERELNTKDDQHCVLLPMYSLECK